jgi:hypothetical protein
MKKQILLDAIDTSMFLLPELPGRVEWLKIPGMRGRMIDGSDPFVSLAGAARLTRTNIDASLEQIHDRFASQNKAYGWIVSPLSRPAGLGIRLERLGQENVLELAGMVHTHLDSPVRCLADGRRPRGRRELPSCFGCAWLRTRRRG